MSMSRGGVGRLYLRSQNVEDRRTPPKIYNRDNNRIIHTPSGAVSRKQTDKVLQDVENNYSPVKSKQQAEDEAQRRRALGQNRMAKTWSLNRA